MTPTLEPIPSATTPSPRRCGRAHGLRLALAVWSTLLVAGGAAAPAAVPVAESASVWVLERYRVETPAGSAYRIPIDLWSFASDADGEALDFAVGPVSAGTLEVHDAGLVVFSIDEAVLDGLTEDPHFQFTVSDGAVSSTAATVTIARLRSIFLPIGHDDSFEVAVDASTDLPVLANDEHADSIASVTQGTRGSVAISAAGTTVIFTPPVDFAPGDSDSFTYVPAGPDGDGAPTAVTVVGESAPPPPIPTPLVVKQRWDGAVIADGAVIPYPGDAIFDFPTSLGIDLHNSGSETLEIVNAATVLPDIGPFTVTPGEAVPSSLGADADGGFRVRLHWDQDGPVSAVITLETRSASGQPYEPFAFTLEAELAVPQFEVVRGWDPDGPVIADGEVIELPKTAPAGSTTTSVAFQIHNIGPAGTLVVRGPYADMARGDCFEVKSGGYPEELVGVGQQTPFRVWWGRTCGPGTYTADVFVETNSVTRPWDPVSDGRYRIFQVVGTVLAELVLTCEPQDARVVAGEPATFTVCTPAGAGELAYAWFKDGQPIAGSGATLTVPAAANADEGLYHVEVTGELGTVVSRAARLTAVEVPQVSAPVGRTVAVGGSATFSVTVISPAEDGPFGYHWQQLPPGASTFQTISGANSATLTVSNATLAMSGTRYRCLVGNDAGQTNSGNATLTVVQAPTITQHPQSQRVVVGSNVSFGVTATGSPSPSYLWTRNGVSLGVTTPTLTLSGVTNANEGTYRVVVSNSQGSVTSQGATLTVVYKPVVSTPASQTVPAGGTATFSVTVSSPSADGSFGYFWQQLPPGASTYQTIPGATSATLTVSNVTLAMSGTRYRCLVGNDAGQTSSGSATLTVVVPDVRVTQNWDGALVGAGSTIQFGSVETGVGTSKRFVITNSGQATLTISNPTSLVSGTCWSQIENAASTVAPGASTYFRVRLLCSSTGTKTGTVTIYSNDPSSPYRFYVQGTVTAPTPPSISVTRNWDGVSVGEGSTFTFPSTSPGTGVSRLFRITNHGPGTLTISNPSSFVSGTCWSQIENASSTVAEGGYTTFRVRLLCSSTGTKSGTVTIYSNEGGTPFKFYVQGTIQ